MFYSLLTVANLPPLQCNATLDLYIACNKIKIKNTQPHVSLSLSLSSTYVWRVFRKQGAAAVCLVLVSRGPEEAEMRDISLTAVWMCRWSALQTWDSLRLSSATRLKYGARCAFLFYKRLYRGCFNMSILHYKRQINIITEQHIWCWWIGQVGELSDIEQKWKRVCLTPCQNVIAPIEISEAV